MSSSPEPCDWAKVNELARMAKNGTPEEQNIAFKKLIPHIHRIARRAVYAFSVSSSSHAEKFIEESPGIIFEKLAHYDLQKDFVPWAVTVLRHAAVDQIREQSKRKEQRASDLQPYCGPAEEDFDGSQDLSNPNNWEDKKSWRDDRHKLDRVLDAKAPIGQEDLAALESQLTAQARVTVLMVLQASHRVPATTWEQWLADAGFPADFQPPTFAPEDDLSQRVKAVAKCFGEAFSTIRMRWQRALPTLRKMKFLRDQRKDL